MCELWHDPDQQSLGVNFQFSRALIWTMTDGININSLAESQEQEAELEKGPTRQHPQGWKIPRSPLHRRGVSGKHTRMQAPIGTS